MSETYTPLQVEYGTNPRTGRVDGWRILTICALLNRTQREQVRKVLPEFFKEFPHAVYAEIVHYSPQVHEHMATIIEPLGFARSRTTRIGFMSKQWFEHEDWRNDRDVVRFYGCGRYAADAWRVFVDRNFAVACEDQVLEKWRRIQYNRVLASAHSVNL